MNNGKPLFSVTKMYRYGKIAVMLELHHLKFLLDMMQVTGVSNSGYLHPAPCVWAFEHLFYVK
jgi:hypothetical protein